MEIKLELEACLQEQKKNKENLLELEKESISEGKLLVRTQADTKAGRRTKNIIYVLPEGRDTFELEISFIGGKVEKKSAKYSTLVSQVSIIAPPITLVESAAASLLQAITTILPLSSRSALSEINLLKLTTLRC
ncbi:hypothetical protein [Salinimonas sediminis]|uniref:hypothetical protein n=1 Tax=Salinimonas sediminis TaxID=2303538 RepID=UPI001E3E8F48|nr:hypothetical protein [Salinimonas sediminis]